MSSLRTSICAAPINAATANAANATHRCARTRRRIGEVTADSALRVGLPFTLWHDANHAPHAAVAKTGEFVARHEAIAGFGERRVHLRDVTGYDHRVDVRASDQHPMNHIRTRDAKADTASGRYRDTAGNEGKLRCDDARGDRAVCILNRAEITFERTPRLRAGSSDRSFRHYSAGAAPSPRWKRR